MGRRRDEISGSLKRPGTVARSARPGEVVPGRVAYEELDSAPGQREFLEVGSFLAVGRDSGRTQGAHHPNWLFFVPPSGGSRCRRN
jgi:hypothetical protein